MQVEGSGSRRLQFKAARTCHDAYLLDALCFNELCVGCSNHRDKLPKRKPQRLMGRVYRCEYPTPNGICMPNENPSGKVSRSVISNSNQGENAVSTDEENVVSSKRKKKKRKIKKIDVEKKILTESLKEAEMKQSYYKNVFDERANKNEELTKRIAELEEQNKNLLDQLKGVAEENETLNRSLTTTKTQLRHKYKEISVISAKISRRSTNVQPNAVHFIKSLSAKGCDEKEIVEGIINVLTSSRKYKGMTQDVITSRQDILPVITAHFGSVKYEELKFKFRPWKCLEALDLSPTVSFRAFDTIRKIEFGGEFGDTKYKRGLFCSRFTLGRLCKILEQHGSTLLPFQITDNCVKFSIPQAVKFLLEHHGLWAYVESGDEVCMAATCDGADLAWNLSQVSAGIKIVDPWAINPLTSQLLFGDSGYDRVQSAYASYPLHVHIAKDNKQFNRDELQGFLI